MGRVEVSFRRSWEGRRESHYNHWTRGAPSNQIQLAFRRHWLTFQSYLHDLPGREVLEVGSGRGSIASYFADAGYQVTLLDTSFAALAIARSIYEANGHPARLVAGDAFKLSFRDGSFSVCVSIGLLEHFDDVETLMREQLRVLRAGGVMLAYVVPERADSVQRRFNWVNRLLAAAASIGRPRRDREKTAKEPLYRNGFTADAYVGRLRQMGVTEVETCGMYPLPMISHSPLFPFTLLPGPLERVLVFAFSAVLKLRQLLLRRDPWLCREKTGQAFLVMARKPR
jgi:SAM-dependent methyltransferase